MSIFMYLKSDNLKTIQKILETSFYRRNSFIREEILNSYITYFIETAREYNTYFSFKVN